MNRPASLALAPVSLVLSALCALAARAALPGHPDSEAALYILLGMAFGLGPWIPAVLAAALAAGWASGRLGIPTFRMAAPIAAACGTAAFAFVGFMPAASFAEKAEYLGPWLAGAASAGFILGLPSRDPRAGRLSGFRALAAPLLAIIAAGIAFAALAGLADPPPADGKRRLLAGSGIRSGTAPAGPLVVHADTAGSFRYLATTRGIRSAARVVTPLGMPSRVPGPTDMRVALWLTLDTTGMAAWADSLPRHPEPGIIRVSPNVAEALIPAAIRSGLAVDSLGYVLAGPRLDPSAAVRPEFGALVAVRIGGFLYLEILDL